MTYTITLTYKQLLVLTDALEPAFKGYINDIKEAHEDNDPETILTHTRLVEARTKYSTASQILLKLNAHLVDIDEALVIDLDENKDKS